MFQNHQERFVLASVAGLLFFASLARGQADMDPKEFSRRLKERLSPPAIVAAALKNDLVQVTALVEAGAKVDESNKITLQTALMAASMKGHLKIVHYLLNKGAAVNARDVNKKQPLHHATGFGHVDVVKRLLKAGADLESGDVAGFTPLIYAAKQGHPKLVDLLLAKGANIEKADNMKITPLMWTAIKGEKSCAEVLLLKGANKKAVTDQGLTAYDFARTAKYAPLLPILDPKK